MRATLQEIVAAVHERVGRVPIMAPPASLTALAAACPTIDALDEEDGAVQSLWSALILAFPMRPRSHSGGMPDDGTLDLWAGWIGWAIAQLQPGPPGPDRPEVRLALMMLDQGHIQGEDWSAAPSGLAQNEPLFELLIGVFPPLARRAVMFDGRLKPVRPDVSLPAGIDGWRAVAETLSHRDVMGPGLLGPVARLLAQLWPDRMAAAMADWMDGLAIAAVVRELPPTKAFAVGLKSGNRLLAFEAVRHCTEAFKLMRPEAEDALVALLVDVAGDVETWSGWMRALNAHPVRHPMLQTPLGRALAQAPLSAFDVWLATQTVLPTALRRGIGLPERPGADVCLDAFVQAASPELRLSAWPRVWAWWNAWDFGDRDLLFDVHSSPLDLGVVGYALECLDEDQLKAALQVEIDGLDAAFGRWWKASTDLTSEINRRQSRIQPLAHARKLRETGTALGRAAANIMYEIDDPDLKWRLGRLRFV